jgi:hypothetical protein
MKLRPIVAFCVEVDGKRQTFRRVQKEPERWVTVASDDAVIVSAKEVNMAGAGVGRSKGDWVEFSNGDRLVKS